MAFFQQTMLRKRLEKATVEAGMTGYDAVNRTDLESLAAYINSEAIWNAKAGMDHTWAQEATFVECVFIILLNYNCRKKLDKYENDIKKSKLNKYSRDSIKEKYEAVFQDTLSLLSCASTPKLDHAAKTHYVRSIYFSKEPHRQQRMAAFRKQLPSSRHGYVLHYWEQFLIRCDEQESAEKAKAEKAAAEKAAAEKAKAEKAAAEKAKAEKAAAEKAAAKKAKAEKAAPKKAAAQKAKSKKETAGETDFSTEDEFYASSYNEALDPNKRQKAIWARALVHAKGDEASAVAEYIRLRVERLKNGEDA